MAQSDCTPCAKSARSESAATAFSSCAIVVVVVFAGAAVAATVLAAAVLASKLLTSVRQLLTDKTRMHEPCLSEHWSLWHLDLVVSHCGMCCPRV